MAHDRDNNSRNDRRDTGRNVRAFKITQSQWQKECAEAFRKHVGDRPGGAKALAAECECNEKTAQNWLDGKTTPSGILNLRAMNAVPAYAALTREIAAMETALDPRLQAKYRELHELTLKLAGNDG